jgi:hypothetical protein
MNEKQGKSSGKTRRVYVYTILTCFVWGTAFACIVLWVDYQTIPPLANMLKLIFLFSLGCFVALIFAFELGLPLPPEGKEHHLFLYPAIAVPIVLVGLEVRNWMLWGRSLFFE